MKKIIRENKDAIKSPESKIDKLDKEIEKRSIYDQDDQGKKENEGDKDLEKQNFLCSYYNRGHCKHKSRCSYIHPRNICNHEGWKISSQRLLFKTP